MRIKLSASLVCQLSSKGERGDDVWSGATGDKKNAWLAVLLVCCKNPGHNQPRVSEV